MSQFFNSSPSFAFTSNNSSPDRNEEYNQSQQQVYHQKILFDQEHNYRRSMPSNQEKKALLNLIPKIKHYICIWKREKKKEVMNILKQRMKQGRLVSLSMMDKFANRYMEKKWRQIHRIVRCWHQNSLDGNLVRYKKQQSIYQIIKIIEYRSLSSFYILKTFSFQSTHAQNPSHSVAVALSYSLQNSIRKHLYIGFNRIKESIPSRIADDPQIYTDILQHVCFLSHMESKKQKSTNVQNDDQKKFNAFRRSMDILKRKVDTEMRIGFGQIFQEWMKWKLECRERIVQLQMIKEKIIEEMK